MQKWKSKLKQLLALMLSVIIVLSVLPTSTWAENDESQTSTWIKVDFNDITSDDKIAITMTASNGTIYALPSATTSSVPSATVSTVSEDTLTIPAGSDGYEWKISGTNEGYYITSPSGSYLYTTAANDGVRVGATEMTWSLDGNYLKATDSKGDARWLGIYTNNPDWRAYTNTTGNTKNQVVYFWKLSDEGNTASVSTPTAIYSKTEEKITFSCSTSGVTYYYSINENEEYTALDGNTLSTADYDTGDIIYFYAVLNGEKSSTASITIPADTDVNEGDVVTIAVAKEKASGTENITVEGTVIYISGKNVYVQDETGGIDLYFSTTPTDISVGNVVRAVGKRASFSGLEELSGVTSYEIIGTDSELPSKTVTISEILEDHDEGTLESTRIYIENAVVSAINGSYTTLIQNNSETETIIIYNLPSGAEVAVGDTINLHAVVGDYNGYQLLVNSASDVTVTLNAETGSDDEDEISYYKPANSDEVVIYYPGSGLALTATASGSRLSGTSANVTGSSLYTDGSELILKVSVDENNHYTFKTSEGKYLTTGATGSSLTLADAESEYSLWELEETDGGWYIKNVNAVYGSNPQYIEYYNGFTTYSLYSGGTIYTMQFFKAENVKSAMDVDSSLIYQIASWGGGGPYDESNSLNIYGDKFEVGDMKDTAAVFTAVAKGLAAQPYQKTSTSTGGYNYYMGGTNIGASEGDYMQFTLSTAGWGDMTLSFRLRATNAAPGSFQLQYSTDGENFINFTSGEYSYAYTQYTSSGSSDVTGSGKITDGVAKTSLAPANYVSFSFDVPEVAENADTLYIRLVAGTERASGTGAVSGNIRIDSVVLTGSPIVDDSITGYVRVTPDGVEEDQPVGTELTMTSSTEGAAIRYRFVNPEGDGNEEWLTYDENNKPVLPALPAVLQVYAVSTGRADSIVRILDYAAGTVQSVKMTPNGGGVYISDAYTEVELSTATEGATIYYSTTTDSDGNDIYEIYDPENTHILLEKGFGTKTIKAYASYEGFNDSGVITRIFTERSQESYNIYFGQMHSHTSYSDGAGTAEDAYEHASGVENLDFLAVTDHSNSFDNADAASISDGSVSAEWVEGSALAQEYTTDTFVGMFGFEMTWSNGLGHINTFNTDGFQSRTQSQYTTYSTALQNYYATLKTVADSISQFNHPGTTFGDFSDFAYYDEEIDQLITLIEVGNGEGAIGSSGYFPSYEYYTRALDKGWHVAPTNNQDNHKGLWGDANTARSVVLADNLTENDIYDAMRNYRVYATEDNDLSIYYTLDGYTMGTILTEDDVDDTVNLTVKLADPTDSAIGKVEVIVNGGYSLASQNVSSNEDTITFTVGADYSYYYIKVTEKDGDIAVTAPVWVGAVEAVGISDFSTDATLAVQNQELNLTLDLYNNEKSEFNIESIEFTIDGKTIHTADLSALTKIGAMDTASYTFSYTYDGLGATNIYAVVKGTLNGVTKVYQDVLQLDYVSAEMVTRVIVDGTHYNDYVTGYYGGNMGNFTSIAAGKSVEVSVVTDEITEETLENCALLVISAPAKKSGTANAGDYVPSTFEDSFIELVKSYVEGGGSVIVCGLADYQDSRSDAELHSSVQLNKLLEAIGSTMSINDDEAYDAQSNGGQFYRLYPSVFNTDSSWTSGVVDGQVYSQYSGCTVNAGEGTWLVKGFDTTYSVDSDKDNRGNTDDIETDDSYGYNIVTPKGEAVFLACEETVYGGTIFAAGGVFLSDFEVDADVDDYALPYANRTIAENILDAVKVELPISTISQVRKAGNAGNRGDVYRVQGYVTSGTAIEENTFFDCIYIQDETGGLDIFPYAEGGLKVGTKIEIIGYLADYQGDLELKVMDYTILDEEPYVYEPELMSNADAMDYEKNGGRLIQVQGTVKAGSLEYNADGTLAQFVVLDENGDEAKVFIDGYILSSVTGKNELASVVKAGSQVSAVGLLYMHPEGNSDESVAVLRVRDCAEILLLSEDEDNDNTEDSQNSGNSGISSDNNEPSDEENNKVQVSNDTSVEIKEITDWDKVIGLLNIIPDGGNITAVLHDYTIVPKAVINSVRGKDVNLIISLENGIIWEINGESITAECTVDIDFGVVLNTNVIPEKLVKEAADGRTYIELSLNHNGLFNLDAYMILNLGKENSGKNAKLYYYNTESGKLELQSSAQIGTNGEAKILFTHASDYVIVIDENVSADNDLNTADQSSYTGFLILLMAATVTVIYTVRKRKAY